MRISHCGRGTFSSSRSACSEAGCSATTADHFNPTNIIMLKLGVIGYGYWGPNVVRNFATQADCRVTIICDGEPVARARASSHYPTVRTVADAMEVVTSPEIDAVANDA